MHASVINHDRSNLFVHNTSFHIFRAMHACIICIVIHKVKYFFPNLFSKNGDMGDRLEARLSTIENIQEEFGHDIREVKEHLARLKSLLEDYIRTQAVHPQGPSPNQQVSRPFGRTTSYLPCGIDRPNLRQPVLSVLSIFRPTARHVDQPSDSRGKPNRQKIDKDKSR